MIFVIILFSAIIITGIIGVIYMCYDEIATNKRIEYLNKMEKEKGSLGKWIKY